MNYTVILKSSVARASSVHLGPRQGIGTESR